MCMISDLDISRTANVLVKQHAQDTPIQAAMLDWGLLLSQLGGTGKGQISPRRP